VGLAVHDNIGEQADAEAARDDGLDHLERGGLAVEVRRKASEAAGLGDERIVALATLPDDAEPAFFGQFGEAHTAALDEPVPRTDADEHLDAHERQEIQIGAGDDVLAG
jgi:hypothetical protein